MYTSGLRYGLFVRTTICESSAVAHQFPMPVRVNPAFRLLFLRRKVASFPPAPNAELLKGPVLVAKGEVRWGSQIHIAFCTRAREET